METRPRPNPPQGAALPSCPPGLLAADGPSANRRGSAQGGEWVAQALLLLARVGDIIHLPAVGDLCLARFRTLD